MLSKEEIEKAKERCNSIVEFCKNNKECQENKICPDCYIEIEDISAIKIFLQYIEQLEQENKTLTQTNKSYKGIINKQNKIIDLMATSINSYDSQLDICQYSNKEEVKQHYEEYLEQYFEKKVEEN